MKEASGEANMTVITIILIGIVLAVATPLVRNMMKTASGRACCVDGGGTVNGSTCNGGAYANQRLSAIADNAECNQAGNQAGSKAN